MTRGRSPVEAGTRATLSRCSYFRVPPSSSRGAPFGSSRPPVRGLLPPHQQAGRGPVRLCSGVSRDTRVSRVGWRRPTRIKTTIYMAHGPNTDQLQSTWLTGPNRQSCMDMPCTRKHLRTAHAGALYARTACRAQTSVHTAANLRRAASHHRLQHRLQHG